jgi:hypothetical protein
MKFTSQSTQFANKEVRPALYSYNVLKIATKDFHQSNKFGEGGFGIVYKVNPFNNLIKQCN